MGHFFPIEGVAGAIALLGAGRAFMLWLYAKMRQSDVNEAFVRSMATNHLPHIQQCLEMIAARVGVELPPTPPVQWIDFPSPTPHS